MKKFTLLILGLLIASVAAMAQVTPCVPSPTTPCGAYPTTGSTGYTPSAGTYTYANPTSPKGTVGGGSDVLGAHNGYGRGCVMCHAPHSGSFGNNSATSGDPQNGMYALWGEDLTPLFGQTFNFSGDGNFATGSTTQNTAGKYPVTLPAAGTLTSAHDPNTVILMCLSCHDGALTKVGMMQGWTVETLPIVGGKAPTLLGLAAPSGGAAYNNDHPVGPNAIVSCGGSYNWDCTGGGVTAAASGSTPATTGAPISMNGPYSGAFLTNYPGSFWNTGKTNGVSVSLNTYGTSGTNGYTVSAVTCTTCHNQHSMNVFSNNKGSFSTMFFLRGQYTPGNNGNSVAQFCRNCHGGESNEMNGLVGVPTI